MLACLEKTISVGLGEGAAAQRRLDCCKDCGDVKSDHESDLDPISFYSDTVFGRIR